MSRLLQVMAAALMLASCATKSPRQFTTTMIGGSEVPEVTTMSEGTAAFKLNPDGTKMSVDLELTAPIDSVTAAHIHLGAAGANGPVIVPLWSGQQGAGFTGRLVSDTITKADLTGPLEGQTLTALADSMARGVTYVNVHTVAFPAGQIRGQIQEKSATAPAR
jgi:hypothetical protein